MRRLLGVLACLTAWSALAPVDAATASRSQTLSYRVPIPAAGDFSILSFELRIGGEGSHHRKQAVTLDLVNKRQPGVFALARLRPEKGHPGRFLGIVEVFHRKTSATQSSRRLRREGHGVPTAAIAGGAADEFRVTAEGERLFKETIKDNIAALAMKQDLGPDEFCDPENFDDYVLGEEVLAGAFLLAGGGLGLPSQRRRTTWPSTPSKSSATTSRTTENPR